MKLNKVINKILSANLYIEKKDSITKNNFFNINIDVS